MARPFALGHPLALFLALIAVPSQAPSTQPLSLPPPSGPYAVGTAQYAVEDAGRPEVGTADPYDVRTIPFQVWYPASPHAHGERAPYVDGLEQWADVYEEAFLDRLGRVVPNATCAAAVHERAGRLPVVLFSPGFGMSRHFYTVLYEDLASHGYAVVALDRPYLNTLQMPSGDVVSPRDGFFDAFPATRGNDSLVLARRQLAFAEGYFAADQTLVLEELTRLSRSDPRGLLTERLDLGRVVNLAHSAGAIAGRALATQPDQPYLGYVFYDSRVDFVAGARDVVLRTEGVIAHPVLFFALEYATPPDEAFADHLRAPLYAVTMSGTVHNSISDLPLLTAMDAGDGGSDARAHLDVLLRRTLAFLNEVLHDGATFALTPQPSEESLVSIRRLGPASE